MLRQKPKKPLSLLRAALAVIVSIVAIYVVADHWDTVVASLRAARGASIGWLALSLVFMALTFCIAAAIYGVLALQPLHYRRTLLVEVATAFVNRLLPSGIGGLGIHGLYLFKQKHTGAEATVVVSVNNLLGIGGHLLLLAAVIAYQPTLLHQFVNSNHHISWRVVVFVLCMIALLLGAPKIRGRLVSFVHHMLVSVRKISVGNVVSALLLAMLLTATYVAILVSVTRSLGLDLSLLQVFIVFSFGILASTATPTPGGLVGAEAGLFGALVAYGVATSEAGAAVLLYRLVTYWLPLLPGAFAVFAARRRQLI
jgi:uncharacterized membrane protein YbhN (UPF0104 family)